MVCAWKRERYARISFGSLIGLSNAEKNAQARYEKIANMLEDSKEKGIFKGLAQEERNHQKILEDEFYHISNKGTIIWE